MSTISTRNSDKLIDDNGSRYSVIVTILAVGYFAFVMLPNSVLTDFELPGGRSPIWLLLAAMYVASVGIVVSTKGGLVQAISYIRASVPVNRPELGLLLFIFVGLVLAVFDQRGLDDISRYLSFGLVYFLLKFFVRSSGASSQGKLLLGLSAVAFAYLIAGLSTLIFSPETATASGVLNPTLNTGRLQGIYGSATGTATGAVVAAGMAILLVGNSEDRRIHYFGIASILLSLFVTALTGSIGGGTALTIMLSGLLLSKLIWVIRNLSGRQQGSTSVSSQSFEIKIWSLVVIVWFLFLAGAAIFVLNDASIGGRVGWTEEGTNYRLGLWSAGLERVANPIDALIGIGFSPVKMIGESLSPPILTASLHNSFVGAFIATGLLGATGFVYWVFGSTRIGMSAIRRPFSMTPITWVVIGLIWAAMFEDLLLGPLTGAFVAWCLIIAMFELRPTDAGGVRPGGSENVPVSGSSLTSRTEVLINGLSAKSGGGTTYLNALCRAISQSGRPVSVTVLLAKNYQSEMAESLDPYVDVRLKWIPRRAFLRVIWEQLWLPILLLFWRPSVLYVPTEVVSLASPVPVVMAIRNPNIWNTKISTGKRWRTEVQRFMTRLSFIKSRAAILPSATAADEVTSALSLSIDRIAPIHHGFDHGWVESSGLEAEESAGPATVLTVSDVARHKNFPFLVESFSKASQTLGGAVSLRIAGGFIDERARADLADAIDRFQVSEKIVLLGRVPHNELASEYSNASCLLWTTGLETFGHGMVEAMAFGVPIVAPDTALCREICGDAAIYFDPKSVDDMSRKLVELVGNAELSHQVIENGLAQAKKFSWDKTADATIDVWINSIQKDGNTVSELTADPYSDVSR